MKKIISIISVVMLLSSIMTSCSDWLDLKPLDNYGGETFWQSEGHVEAAMLDIHRELRGKYGMFYTLGEARGGTYRLGTSSVGGVTMSNTSPMKDNTLSENTPGVNTWYDIYNPLLDVNHFIDKVENDIDFLSEGDKSFYLGQAYGVRAYFYYWLYRTYGGVPIITTTKVLDGQVNAEDLYTARSTPKETMDFIKSDIQISETYFANDFAHSGEKSMWSLAATKVLKGDVYLWSAKVSTGDQTPAPNNADATTAKNALLEVYGDYSLLDNFSDVFAYDKKGNDEVIMTMRFLDAEADNNAGAWLGRDDQYMGSIAGKDGEVIENNLYLAGGAQFQEYKKGLYDLFDEEDKRRDVTFFAFYDLKTDDNSDTWSPETNYLGSFMHKNIGYINSNNVRVFAGDMHIYRYAEVLLFLAEVENLLGGTPSKYINEVRERAYGSDYVEATHAHTYSSFAETEFAILQERDKEFVFEGKRWFDVLRLQDANKESLVFSADANYRDKSTTDELLPLLDKENESHMVLWPVNIGVMNNDPLVKQTPGYVTKY